MFELEQDQHPDVLRVLVVENDEADAALLVAALRADGLTIDARCVATEAALRTALSWEPHVILTDYRLAGFDALSVIRIARERASSPPVVLVAEAIGEDLATEAIKQGAVDFLFKDRLGRLGAAVRTAVTVRRLAEERTTLQDAFSLERGLLESLLETLPDAIYVKDTALRFQRLNGATAAQLGLSRPDQAVGRTDADFFPAAMAAEYEADERRILASGEPLVSKLERQEAGDETRWVLATKVPIRDPEGTAIGLVGINRDVTERTRLEEELRASERKFRSLVDHLPAVVYVLAGDERLTTTYFSPRLEALTGYTPQEAIAWRNARSWLEAIHPDDRARVGAEAARAVATGTPFRAEYRQARKDGSYVWVLDEGVPVRDDAGTIVAWHGVLLDISERVQAEEERSRLAAIVESAEDGILGTNLDGTITSWNYGAEKLYGYRIDEAVGRNIAMLRPPELAADIAEMMEGVRRGASIAGHETVRLTRDRRRVRVSLSHAPIRDVNGKVVGIGSISRDVTALREAEAALRLRDRALAATTNGVLIIDATAPNAPIVDVNHAVEHLTGYTRDEAVGESLRMLFGPDTDPAAARRIREAILAGDDITETVLTYRRDGTAFWGHHSIAAVRDPAGSLTHFVGVLTDVSERIEAEAALRESEARFREVWENTRDAMALTDREGTILAINPAHTHLYGFSSDSIVGRHFSIIYPEADRAELTAANRALFAETVLPPSFESTIQHEDGSERETEIQISFIEADGARQVMVSAIRDVTERKRLEHELRHALHAAQAATQSKSLFLAMMSHELRTPLQAVLGYTDFLLLGPEDALTAEQAADLGYIRQGALRMMTLVDDLLDLSRMEAGQLELVAEPVDLAVVMEQVRQDIAPQAGAKGLALHIDIPPALSPVRGDPARLRQVLLNLAANAVKFTHQGEVSISARPSGDGISIAVRDTGIGITAEEMPAVFEEFRQVDSSLTRRYGGAGLGLTIAKRLVGQMGGSITVASQPGQGSTFTVQLQAEPGSPGRKPVRRRRRERAERAPRDR